MKRAGKQPEWLEPGKGKRRGTHCARGHEFPPVIEYWPNGRPKGCMVCKREYASKPKG
jgi:hypothetical protein